VRGIHGASGLLVIPIAGEWDAARVINARSQSPIEVAGLETFETWERFAALRKRIN
jgi:hypothetical protein